MNIDLSGRVALITGASKGIGRAVTLELASLGTQVCILSRSAENLQALSNEVVNRGGVAPLILPGDLADTELAERIVDQVVEAFQRIDILVNNGEGPPPGSFIDKETQDWTRAFETNLLAPINFSKKVVPMMKVQKWGRIINVTSLQAKEPTPPMVLSATMRAGLSAFSKAISIELAEYGITVNTVCPSAVSTDRMVNLTRLAAEKENKTYEEILERALKSIPMKRFSTPEEIADLVAFLASPSAAYMTGLSINIDGGLAKSTF